MSLHSFVCLCIGTENYISHRQDFRLISYLTSINPLNPELNPICYLLALLGAHRFLRFSRIRVKSLTFRLVMSYIYMEHPFYIYIYIYDISRLRVKSVYIFRFPLQSQTDDGQTLHRNIYVRVLQFYFVFVDRNYRVNHVKKTRLDAQLILSNVNVAPCMLPHLLYSPTHKQITNKQERQTHTDDIHMRPHAV